MALKDVLLPVLSTLCGRSLHLSCSERLGVTHRAPEFLPSDQVWIARNVDIIPDRCFEGRTVLCEVVFEEKSVLKRIGKQVFAPRIMGKPNHVESIRIPKSVEVLCDDCFMECSS
jgi:hypothetical protein